MDYSCGVPSNGVIHLLKESNLSSYTFLKLSDVPGMHPPVPSSTSTGSHIPTVPLNTTGNITAAAACIVIQNYLLNKSVNP